VEPTTGRTRSAWLLAALAAVLPAVLGCPKSDDPAYYIARLGRDDTEVQRRAVEDLLLIHKKAMPFVKEAVKSENPYLRQGCATFLARVRRMESLTTVGELVDDPDPTVRLAAIEAVVKLAQVWKSKAVELLARGFEGEEPVCVKTAGEGLRDMEFDEATDYLQAQFDAGQGIQTIYAAKLLYETEGKAEFTRPILEGLISEERDVREAAKANAYELKDLIVVPLVAFVRTEERTALAGRTLEGIRDVLREELDVILDSKQAEKMLMALGAIGDDASVERLNADLHDSKLESTWRVAAARAMAAAALSTPDQSARIVSDLRQVVDDEKEDTRIQIGAAIALCKLKEQRGVEFLLDMLDSFEEAIAKENISEERLHDLTALRIGSQEALAEAGEFVVPVLMARLRGSPSPTIMWAAAKTLGEIRHEEAMPYLGKFLITQKVPGIAVDADGRLSGEAADADWRGLTEAEAAEVRAKFEVFEYPDYVRWTAALALGRIGGTEAVELLHQGEKAEAALLDRLAKSKAVSGYFNRAPVMDELMRGHEDVLFYIRRALQDT